MICARPEIVMASAQAPANCATFNIASEICFPRSAGNGAELEAALAECSFQVGSFQPVNFEAVRHFAACCGCSKLQCSQSISVFVLRTKQKLYSQCRVSCYSERDLWSAQVELQVGYKCLGRKTTTLDGTLFPVSVLV